MKNKFSIGEEVLIKSLKKKGEILEHLRSGNYKLALGALVIECKEKDLVPTPAIKKSKITPYSSPTPPKGSLSVDLHGLRVEEALSLVGKYLDKAILEGFDSLEIIHGIGTGKIKNAVQKYLKSLSVVKEVRTPAHNPGVTLLYF